MERKLKSFSKDSGNRRILLNEAGVKSIAGYKKMYPDSRNVPDDAIYRELLNHHNEQVDAINEQHNKKQNVKLNVMKQISKLKGTNKININLRPVHQYLEHKDFMKFLLTSLRKKHAGKKLMLQVGSSIYALGEATNQRLNDLIMNNMEVNEETTGSDQELNQEIIIQPKLSVYIHHDVNQRKKPRGGFFKFYNKTHYNLESYGIYKNEEDYSLEGELCLLYALKQSGLNEVKIELLKTMVFNTSVPISKLGEICDKLEIQIKLHRDGSDKIGYYGKKYSEVYDIGLIDDHYFIYNTSSNTSYSIIHYEDIKEIPDCNQIYKKDKYYKKSNKSFLNSLAMIRLLLKHRDICLEPIPYEHLCRTQYYKKADETFTTLEYDDSVLEPIVYEEKDKKDKPLVNVFMDFETRTKDITRKHYPYLVRYIMDNGRKGVFYGEDCCLQLLFYLTSFIEEGICFIAHNMTYDYRFIIKNLIKLTEISKGNKLIVANGYFGKTKIMIKDSYHLISNPLRDFGEMFKLEQKKEIMPYALYNIPEYFDMRYIEEDIILNGKDTFGKPFLKESEKEDFIKNVELWNLKENGKIDIIEYSNRYCELDCLVLRNGYNIFRQWILDLKTYNDEDTHLDINNILTSASLAHTYLLKSGCYEGLYSLTGVVQRFHQKTVVGGRTMCSDNKMQDINSDKPDEMTDRLNRKQKTKILRKINDFDGVSLYPSAMYRMDGFLKGKPKVLKTTDYNIINNYSGYFVEVKIKNIPIKRSFPLVSYINDKGVRIFSNEIDSIVYMDKIQLEDLITFQGLTTDDFDIIRGYYYDEGFNTNIKKTIKHLFNERKKKKKEENPCETIYKLIMNSAYGKSIMKEIRTETRIIDNEHDYNVFISRNYDFIETINPIDNCNKWKINTISPISSHCNIAQVGSSVLSWSKRIMNEVMTTAEDNGIEIFYQDTDSMHLFDDSIPLLTKSFSEKYKRPLIGKDLGQFHSDFKIKDCEDVYSTRLIALGKKSYCDVLVGKVKATPPLVKATPPLVKNDYHIRMKGIPNSCIIYTAEQKQITPIMLYDDLLNGSSINFDLTQGQHKDIFKFNSNYAVHTLQYFERSVKFQ